MHFTHSKQTITSCVKVSSSSLMSELLFTGNNTDSWAVHLDSREFQLLCSQESRAEVTQYTKCNLARVPSHAVMIRPDTNHHVIFGLLDKAQVDKSKCNFSRSFENRVVLVCMTFLVCIFQNFFGVNAASGFKMFDSKPYEGSDLLFKDSTITLIGVGERKTYEEWLGQSYLDAVIAMECSASSTGMALISRSLYIYLESFNKSFHFVFLLQCFPHPHYC